VENKLITFTILMEPVAKGRPRATWIAGKAHTYTPEKTRTAEEEIKWQIISRPGLVDQCYGRGVPLKLEATFYKARPKSLPKRVVLPVGKSDVDNMLKTLIDGMEGLLFPNDSQITSVVACKRYGGPPRIEVRLTEDNE